MHAILTHRGTKKTEFTESSLSKTLHIYLLMSEVDEQGKRKSLLDTEVSSTLCQFIICLVRFFLLSLPQAKLPTMMQLLKYQKCYSVNDYKEILNLFKWIRISYKVIEQYN